MNCFFCVLSLSSFSAWFNSLGRFHSLSRGFIRCSGLECGREAGVAAGEGYVTVEAQPLLTIEYIGGAYFLSLLETGGGAGTNVEFV